MEIISIAVGAVLFGITLWGTVKAYDRYNPRNKLALAMFVGLVFAFAAPALGMFLIALPMVALCYLLINYYDIGLIKSLFVCGAMMIANFGHAEIMKRIAEQL